MTARLTPVSENTEGEPVSENTESDTVRGRISAMVANGCPGPAGLWKCAREFGHEDGEHVRMGEGVSKLKAERDELLAALKDLHRASTRDYAVGRIDALAFVRAGNAIAKAEEGR